MNMFAVVIDCADPRLQANFWAEVLSYDVPPTAPACRLEGHRLLERGPLFCRV